MPKAIVPRTGYLRKLNNFRDKTEIVKIITGMRRCGKSTLLCQFQEQLREEGFTNIVYLNFESREYDQIDDYKALNRFFDENIDTTTRSYIFLDEIQRVDNWEKSINSLLVDNDSDIYITGSNAYILSSELSTYLSGRYVEIPMLPLSFKEYLQLHPADGNRPVDVIFNDYVRLGAIPIIDPSDAEVSYDLLNGIYSTIIRKDVALRTRTIDIGTIDDIVKYLMSNIGNITNTLTIAKDISSTPVTVKRYLQCLQDVFLFYRANRYDVNGRKYLKSNEKYYSADVGLRNVVINRPNLSDVGHLIENIVYLELKRRGYKISVGSYYNKEIDFVAEKEDSIEYYQVAASILDEKTFKREIEVLESIPDNYPKKILTLDRIHRPSFNGIQVFNLIDWLLGNGDY